MEVLKTRWATSEGVFLFQVPKISSILNDDTIMFLSSSLYAVNVFFSTEQIKFSNEKLSIIRINFHPPLAAKEDVPKAKGYVIHSSFNQGLSLHSIFEENSLNNRRSEFEKAFLDSIVNNLVEKLLENGKHVSDILYQQDKSKITEVEGMLHEIDDNYSSIVESWVSVQNPNCDSRFVFDNVLYNGKIGVEELFYDLGERAIESFNALLMSKEEKIVLYKIAKALVGLSSLLYESKMKAEDDYLNFNQSEIILESEISKKLYRLDIRSYEMDGIGFCDITILSN